MTYKNALISIVISLIVGMAAFTTLSYHPQNNTAEEDEAQLPDAFMEDVHAIVMDKQGKPSMKIVTPKLVHYAEDDSTQFITPQLTLFRKSPQPWYITSKSGRATDGIDNIDFWDNVVIQHAADISSPATLIKTITLTVHPNKQTAETTAAIQLIQPNTVITATGMYADMNSGDIRLLSQARGEYVPNS